MRYEVHILLGILLAPVAVLPFDVNCRCTNRSAPCWPNLTAWAQLNASVGGRLVLGSSALQNPVGACLAKGKSQEACSAALKLSGSTEWWNMKFSEGFQTAGLHRSWSAALSEHAVKAIRTEDVQAAVLFATRHNLRLTVKGTGHSFQGSSQAKGSLLIWTHPMQGMTWAADNSTVTVSAGVPWEDVYMEAQSRGRHVTGGHCPSVGAVGGFPLGGGYGHFARAYGTAADNMVSALVVVASGDAIHVNESSHPDLFWALRGGGGGTFGVVTSITYRTWPAPRAVGRVQGKVVCSTETNFDLLLHDFVVFLPSFATPHWGGNGVDFSQGPWGISFDILYFGIEQAEAKAVLDPFLVMVHKAGCFWEQPLSLQPLPSISLPDGSRVARIYPYVDAHYTHTGDAEVDSRWTSSVSRGQVNNLWTGYTSRYILLDDLREPADAAAKFKRLLLLKNSSGWNLRLNKGLLGGAGFHGQNVSYHPAARQAVALLLAASSAGGIFPTIPESKETLQALKLSFSSCPMLGKNFSVCFASDTVPDMPDSQVMACWAGVHFCLDRRTEEFNINFAPALREAFSGGAYHNEGDYYEPDWRSTFWGPHYPKLRAIKAAVDPSGLFVCHHCVGSEDWSEDGNCRRTVPLNLASDRIFSEYI